jgi:hypothetical protein
LKCELVATQFSAVKNTRYGQTPETVKILREKLNLSCGSGVPGSRHERQKPTKEKLVPHQENQREMNSRVTLGREIETAAEIRHGNKKLERKTLEGDESQ